MPKKNDHHYSTPELEDMLEKKYDGDAWVKLWEVRDSTGFSGRGRSADAMIFGTWPSRGLQVLGFEIKSLRSDWKKELVMPAKAESIARYCDQWWIVAPDYVVNLEEVPPKWGWYAPHSRGLKAMKQPAESPTKDIDRQLLMSIVRNISRTYVSKTSIRKETDALVKAELARRREHRDWRNKELEELAEHVRKFKEASGIDLAEGYSFPAKETGEIVKMVLDNHLPSDIEQMRRIATRLTESLNAVNALPYFKKSEKEKTT